MGLSQYEHRDVRADLTIILESFSALFSLVRVYPRYSDYPSLATADHHGGKEHSSPDSGCHNSMHISVIGAALGFLGRLSASDLFVSRPRTSHPRTSQESNCTESEDTD